MPANVEIKARAPDLAALRARAFEISDGPVTGFEQEDVFFAAPRGRLKLRFLAADRGELIHYHRPDVAGPKTSEYLIAATSSPQTLRAILAATLAEIAVVRKRRELLRVGQTRVHLDRVEGLGDFVELEVVLRPGQPESEGVAIAEALLERLGIGPEWLVACAYVDLLMAGK